MFNVSKFDWYVDIKNNTFVIEDNIKTILEKYYDNEYNQLTIKKKKWEAYMLEWSLEFFWDDEKFVTLKRKYLHSKVEANIYDWNINKYNLTEKIKLKKDIENEA